MKIKGEDVTASAETKIPVLFMKSTPFSYTSSSEAPVLAPPPDDQFSAFGGLGGGPLPTGGGSLANPVAVAPGCGITCYSGHTGQDFPGAVGTPIVAAEAGRLRFAILAIAATALISLLIMEVGCKRCMLICSPTNPW